MAKKAIPDDCEEKEIILSEEEAINCIEQTINKVFPEDKYKSIEDDETEDCEAEKEKIPEKIKKKRVACPRILFVSEILRKLKLENSPIPYKQRMKVAHDLWKEQH